MEPLRALPRSVARVGFTPGIHQIRIGSRKIEFSVALNEEEHDGPREWEIHRHHSIPAFVRCSVCHRTSIRAGRQSSARRGLPRPVLIAIPRRRLWPRTPICPSRWTAASPATPCTTRPTKPFEGPAQVAGRGRPSIVIERTGHPPPSADKTLTNSSRFSLSAVESLAEASDLAANRIAASVRLSSSGVESPARTMSFSAGSLNTPAS